MQKLFTVTVATIIWTLVAGSIHYADNERLANHLLKNYDPRWLPQLDSADTIRVNMGVALIAINEIDKDRGLIELNSWMRYQWTDVRLRWEPSEYGGIDILRLSPKVLWKPDIVVYNSADEKHRNVMESDALAVLTNLGRILYIPPKTLRTITDPTTIVNTDGSLTFRLKFGSWTYDGFKLDLDFFDGLQTIDVTNYQNNSNWKLLDTPGVKNIKYYACCAEPYPNITFNVTVARNSKSWFGII